MCQTIIFLSTILVTCLRTMSTRIANMQISFLDTRLTRCMMIQGQNERKKTFYLHLALQQQRHYYAFKTAADIYCVIIVILSI